MTQIVISVNHRFKDVLIVTMKIHASNVVLVTILIQLIKNAIDVKIKAVKSVCKDLQHNVQHVIRNIIFPAQLVFLVGLLLIFANFVMIQIVFNVKLVFILMVILVALNVHHK
jgi:hypothetical protein